MPVLTDNMSTSPQAEHRVLPLARCRWRSRAQVS